MQNSISSATRNTVPFQAKNIPASPPAPATNRSFHAQSQNAGAWNEGADELPQNRHEDSSSSRVSSPDDEDSSSSTSSTHSDESTAASRPAPSGPTESAAVGQEEASQEFHLSFGPAEPRNTIGLCACEKMVGELAKDYLCQQKFRRHYAMLSLMAAIGIGAGAVRLMNTLPYDREAFAGQLAGGVILFFAAATMFVIAVSLAMGSPQDDE